MHERFRYRTKGELLAKAEELGLELPYSDDISILFTPVSFAGVTVSNRFVVQPMEGYDSENDGSPSDLTRRRYLRYASGGSAVIWFEAVSAVPEGRSNPHQLWINKNNLDKYSRLNEEIRKTAIKQDYEPYIVMQLTHSGRYSKPEGKSEPLVAAANPVLDKIPPRILTDDELKRLIDMFVDASKLAYKSGFNAVDLKACHGYLIVDLLAAVERSDSIFGGTGMEKRFRFLIETFERVKYEVPDILVTTRLNISDLYQGGFGVDENGNPDFTEPVILVEKLKASGLRLLNITMGSPYHNPNVNRPFNNPVPGQILPDEHPLEGVMRMIKGTGYFQSRFPDISIVGSAYSYLRHFAPNVASGVLNNGMASLIGFGRNSFAYPSMPFDLKNKGKADPGKTCITCSGCTRLIKNLKPSGCVIHDREIYANELKKLIADGK